MKKVFEKGGNMKKMFNPFVILLLLGSFVAQAKGTVDLKNEAFLEKEETNKDGSKIKKLVPATKVLPGEEVIFVITYKNVSKEAATDIVVTNPIPKNMTYKTSDADAGANAEVSVDGGKAFGNLASLKVKDKLRKVRPALPSDVTHVRWKVAGTLQPNAEGKMRLRAVLN